MEYQSVLKEANGYYSAAKGGYNKQKKFSTDLTFSIMAMAIEKYLVAILLADDILPEGHTVSGLIEEIERKMPLDEEMKKHLLKVDEYMFLCSLDAFKAKTPTAEEMEDLFIQVENLKTLANEKAMPV